MKYRQVFSVVAILALVLTASVLVLRQTALAPGVEDVAPVESTLNFNDKQFEVLLADTAAKRVQGLSGRPSLDENQVMLFVFESHEPWGIWMKDMKFAIDIVWLNEAKQVVHIERNVSPDTYPETTFRPPVPSRYVAEFTAGVTEQIGLNVGNSLNF